MPPPPPDWETLASHGNYKEDTRLWLGLSNIYDFVLAEAVYRLFCPRGLTNLSNHNRLSEVLIVSKVSSAGIRPFCASMHTLLAQRCEVLEQAGEFQRHIVFC